MQSEGLHSAEFLSEVTIIIFKTSKTSPSPLAIWIPVNFNLLQFWFFWKGLQCCPNSCAAHTIFGLGYCVISSNKRVTLSWTIKQPIELTITRFPGLFRFNLTHKTVTKLDEKNLEGRLTLTVLFSTCPVLANSARRCSLPYLVALALIW